MSVTHEPVAMMSEPRGFLAFVKNFHNRTILFRVGNFIFVTYGMIAGLAFGLAALVAFWYNASTGVDFVSLGKFYLFFMLPSVLLGARLFSILLEWRQLFVKPFQTLVKPGYMLHGGVFGGTVALFVYGAVGPVGILNLLDTWGLAMPLGEAIIRLGCYVYGCCWGKPTHSHFGVSYTSPHSKVVRCAPHLHGVKIHPAQIYALTAHLVQFGIFCALLSVRPFDGLLAGLYMMTHPVIRVMLERFRQDDRGKLIGPFTHTNLYSLVQFMIGVGIFTAGLISGHLTPLAPVSLVSILGNLPAVAIAGGIGIIAAVAFGLHYKNVGAWVSTPSAGMAPAISEMSMGAAQRAEEAEAL